MEKDVDDELEVKVRNVYVWWMNNIKYGEKSSVSECEFFSQIHAVRKS